MTGIERITKERTRQIQREGWTPEHDDEHVDGELAIVAACYATAACCQHIYVLDRDAENHELRFVDPWPDSWALHWDKRSFRAGRTGRIRMLEKAGALIAAEIDRILREEANGDEANK